MVSTDLVSQSKDFESFTSEQLEELINQLEAKFTQMLETEPWWILEQAQELIGRVITRFWEITPSKKHLFEFYG
jgi:hypothetical protein